MQRKEILAKFGPWILGFLVLGVIYLLREVLTPFLLASLVAYILNPLVGRMERRMSRGLAVGLLTVLLMLILCIFLPLLTYRVAKEAVNFVEAIPKYVTQIGKQISGEMESNMPDWLQRSLREALVQWQIVMSPGTPGTADLIQDELEQGLLDDLEDECSSLPSCAATDESVVNPVMVSLRAFQSKEAGDVARRVSRGTLWTIGWTANIFIQGFVFIVVTVYLLKDFPKILTFLSGLIPRHYFSLVRGVVMEIDRHLRSFFRGALTVSAVLSVIYLIGLLFLRVPFSYVISVVAGLANIIPYCGPFLGAALSLLVTWFTFHSPGKLLAILCLFLFAQILDNTILTPRIVGGKVGLHPVWIIFSIMACGAFLGFFGILLAVPIAATIKVILSEILKRYKTSAVFTGGESTQD